MRAEGPAPLGPPNFAEGPSKTKLLRQDKLTQPVRQDKDELKRSAALYKMALSLRVSETALAHVNLGSAALAARLPAQRCGDPLGLGQARPAAPADPDAGTYTESGARELLSAVDRSLLDAEVRAHGYLTPAAVRSLIAENCTRGQLENGGLDPEFLLLIDARINYKIFIAGDSVYTREELYANFPFYEFGVQPEAVFVAQEVGLFEMPVRSVSRTPAAPTDAPDYDYAVRDAGDQRLEFSPAEDLVRAACGGPPPRTALRIIQTKVFVGREAWEDFTLQMKFYRGAIRIAAAGGAPLALTAVPESSAVAPAEVAPASATLAPVSATLAPVGATLAPVSATLAPVGATLAPASATLAPAGDIRVTALIEEVAALKQRLAALEAQVRHYI